MTGNSTPEEVHGRYQGDKDLMVRRVRENVAKDQRRADVKVASTARVAELQRKITENNLLQDPQVVRIVEKSEARAKDKATAVSDLRDYVMTKILAQEALGRAQAEEPNAQVLTGVKVFEKQAETSTAEWRSNNPGKDPRALTKREGSFYMERREIDVLVVAPAAGAKARVLHREEIKTGTTDTPSEAKAQLDGIGELLARGETGTIRLELNGKNITAEIDLASDAAASKVIRGPADKQFGESLGATSGDLERLFKSLFTEAAAQRAARKDTA